MSYSEITINGQQIKLITLGKCACGCGGRTNIAKRNDRKAFKIKGSPVRYILGHQMRGRCLERNNNWHGGKCKKSKRYTAILNQTHPRADIRGYVPEHILIAEMVLGKYLPVGVEVHHINGKKDDNRRENLIICQSRAYHFLLHRRERALKICGHADWRQCGYCHKFDIPTNLYFDKKGFHPRHSKCCNEYWSNRKRMKNGNNTISNIE